ncbi:hypothetical protein PFICI_13092 [Pestalotiopsis fici W106-1]|uniref:CCZ1/INTU/HSP4 first Longin domain-containing protein n=1 Tax=Pestalotiopsis fici (strain W106-1 / CGMCC3.15140) TaxID=1229662 RepID=W3WL55_PESFW|nr:uncharacterized protein PFICI_13092 [Pestalotiopsis fici W106-1]ETS74608.1 hypothetical protein PFICI_13092 [Pestalotiopsis fici W106-1]
MTPTSTVPQPAVVVPAQLGFLAIFNPSLGATDDTIDDQIVYYASVSSQEQHTARKRHRGSKSRPTEALSQDERNERLRQIGLAQGMVEFGRGFAGGKPIDVIETQKARVVLRELEPGWWILASIDLTRLPLPPRLGGYVDDDDSENVEYSARELKPAALLLQDLLRAHSTFLLHHAASLSALFVRSKRSKFVTLLSRYWDLFSSTWNVMLHGNPACSVFGGIKVASCGELGVGVGEEDRGSGEREVLEGFVDRVEGLVDLVVSKFGEADPDKIAEEEAAGRSIEHRWIGTGEEPGAEDGAIFLGIGALSRHSLRDLTRWMEDIYTWGEDAYGVKENPTSTRTRTRRQRRKSVNINDQAKQEPEASNDAKGDEPQTQEPPAAQDAQEDNKDTTDASGASRLVNYLKLGYGTHWSLGSSENSTNTETKSTTKDDEPVVRPRIEARSSSRQSAKEAAGHFLIGLQGDVDDDGSIHSAGDSDQEQIESRTRLRTLTVELEKEARDLPEEEKTQDLGSGDHELKAAKSGRKNAMDSNSHFDSQDRNKTKRMRVVVYVSKPFIYTFLFENRTDSLAWDSLYKSLHHQLEPLRKPLASSTLYRPGKPDAGAKASHIFDLIWDPKSLIIHSTIPSIPEPISVTRPETRQPSTWTRLEALSTHMQMLQTYGGTRDDHSELERTSKTSRGWWVVWTRVLESRETTISSSGDIKAPPSLPGESSQDSEISNATGDSASSAFPSVVSAATENVATTGNAEVDSGATPTPHEMSQTRRKGRKLKVSKEIFLIRRAGESASRRNSSLSQISEGREGWMDGASRLAQGIGVDTKRYIEDLLSLAQ